MSLTIVVLGLPFMLAAVSMLMENRFTNDSRKADLASVERRDACYTAARQLIRTGELTRALGQSPRTILAPTDLGAEILFFTPHRIIASNYHREGAGIRYVWESEDVSSQESLREYLTSRAVDALLVCPNLRDDDGSILVRYYKQEKVANWLHPIAYKLPSPPPGKQPDSNKLAQKPLLLLVSPSK